MNPRLKAAVIALLTCSAQLTHADVEVVVKLIEVAPDIAVTTDLALLDQQKGVGLVSAPLVTVKFGTKAKIAITRDFQIEGQDAIPVGIDLEITAKQSGSGMAFVARYKLTEFEGFSDSAKKERAIFKTITIPFNGFVEDKSPMLIEVGSKNDAAVRRYIHLTMKNVSR